MCDFATISMDSFPLRWRFSGTQRGDVTLAELEHILPLDENSARYLWERRPHIPDDGSGAVAADQIISIAIDSAQEKEKVRNWLLQMGVPPGREVFASWDNTLAARTNWDIIVKYWSLFWHPASDDLFVFDRSRSWLLLLSHEEEAFFWTKLSVEGFF